MTVNGLAVIVPTRGRPGNAVRLWKAWKDTATVCDLWFAVDRDDPHLADYQTGHLWAHTFICDRPKMAGALNQAVERIVCSGRTQVGFLGDDHLPRTPGWDTHIVDTLGEMGTGICYGNDLFQGERLPTAVFMTADIPKTLGYMCPPGFQHLFLDNCWKAWGDGLGRLRYLPDVIIEHLHPQGGKAEWDDGYRRVNGPEMWQSDSDAWDEYRAVRLDRDLEKLRGLL